MKYTLAFDVYGTLIDTSGVFDALEKRVGMQAKAFMEMWRNKQLEYSFRRGLMNHYIDFSVCTAQALDYCCLAFKINLSKEQKSSLMEVYKVLPAFPDAKATLAELNGTGHRLFAYSIGSRNAVSELLVKADILHFFEGIVSMEELKTFKPNPKGYAHFNKVTHTEISKSWLISGNSFDVIGALSYGMKAAWVKRSPDQIFDPWGIEPTKIISSIAELKNALD
ncbi:haloacid dehalogenase type II [Flexithrix dorotheae]|uniref:haloacid dehalogenase type II n=1 Tax=Flexithrix dorotheae TaxID=70993 RepID=UPI00039DD5C9|nr:haloacid dehalogenase type II [Flexithrix dorotheae]